VSEDYPDMIAIKNLHKRYGDRVAVQDISFEARDGEITGLLGANGAGKTTTLRIIAGLLKPGAGSVRVDGPLDSMGALLDHTGLYSRLTARENIAYFGRLRGVTALGEQVHRMIEELGLDAIADRRAGDLSAGERLKVALGRALVHSPRNLLLDEPTNGLDIPTVRSLRDLLRQMRARGRCMLFSSHVLEEVQALCDRIVVIARGAVVANGSPEQLCREAGCGSLEEAYLRFAGPGEAAVC
jgi:sodium transport system ATP-binding protein